MRISWRESILALVGGLMALLTGFAFYMQFGDTVVLRQLQSTEYARVEAMRRRLEEQLKFQEELKTALVKSPERVETAVINQKLKDFEDKIAAIQNQTVGLRQAINPTKPEEILTIARLTDEVRILRKDTETFHNSMATQQKLFQESILRETTSSNASTNLILIVLIPLVLNFLYTVWKDFRRPPEEKNPA